MTLFLLLVFAYLAVLCWLGRKGPEEFPIEGYDKEFTDEN